jgi:diguanylate cyclase (GGDEF)-like protein
LPTERVLLVEADSISTQLLSFSLRREGFEVVLARDGEDALRLAREQQVDVVLAEVLLPDMDGRDLCRQLRADWNTQRLPIVLATSLGGAENRMQGLLAGADDYIIKPYDVRELMVRLHRLVSTYTNCSDLHPLTKLPGSRVIAGYVEKVCVEESGQWALLQVDINHFTSYNRIYGFSAGDDVLRMTALLLREVVHSSAEPSFVGHDGRDDFIAVVPAQRADEVCRALIERFDVEVLQHYPAEHRESGYQVLIDRRGNSQLVPRLSLSIGVVTYDLCDNLSYLEIREAAESVLNRARCEETSFTYVNRRHLAGRLPASHASNGV